ncbi:Nucleoporin Nup43 [Rhizophlyctis rosea]|nr:Nucleoporin Nup43 [Rhizophlyctis rosea]
MYNGKPFHFCTYDHPAKVSKARWGPTPHHSPSLLLATGTFDTPSPTITISTVRETHDASRPQSTSFDITSSTTEPFQGDVTDLEWTSQAGKTMLVAGSSKGAVVIYEFLVEGGGLKFRQEMYPFRSERVGVTAVGVQPHAGGRPLIAASGSDAAISLLDLRGDVVQRVGVVEPMPITGMVWRTTNEIATSSSAGNIRLIDTRTGSKGAPLFSLDQAKRIPINCITVHPTQPEKLATGTKDGTVQIWDVRNPSAPQLELHPIHGGDSTYPGVGFVGFLFGGRPLICMFGADMGGDVDDEDF